MQRALKEAFKGVPFDMIANQGRNTSGGVGGSGGAMPRGGGSSVMRGTAGGTSAMSGDGGGRSSRAVAEPESIRGVEEALNLPHINHDKWLTLPRKYTRTVSRFELPIDSTELSRKHNHPLVHLLLFHQCQS